VTISIFDDNKDLERKLKNLDNDLKDLGKIDESEVAKIDVLLSLLVIKYSRGEDAIPGITEAKLKSYYKHYRQPGTKDSKTYKLGELLDQQDSRKELVRGMIPEGGLTLVGAQPKTGKSLLMYELIYCLLTHTPFLGFTTRECQKIAFYQLEEPKSIVSHRLKTRGFKEAVEDYNWSEKGKELITLRSLQLVGKGLQNIKEFIEKERPDVVIIDSLRAATYTSNISENSAEWAFPLYFLQTLCKDYDTTIIVIHHFNKAASNGSTRGTISDFAGTSAITGNCDMMIMLYRDIDSNNIKLKTIPREGETIYCDVERLLEEGERFKYARIVSNSVDKKNILIETLILYYLYPRNKLTKTEIANKIYTVIPYDEEFYSKCLSSLYSSGVVDTERVLNGTEKTWYYLIKSGVLESGDLVLYVTRLLYKIISLYTQNKDKMYEFWEEIKSKQNQERLQLLKEAINIINPEISLNKENVN